MAKQQPNRHHYLPELYLGAWRQPNRPLIRYVKERDGIHTREFYPGGVGYRTGLYKLQSATIKDGQVLETHHFEKLDSAAALVFARMIRDSTVRLAGNDNETIAKLHEAITQ